MALIFEKEAFDIVGCCMEVHKTLGTGFLEAVYQEALALELGAANIPFEQEKPISITYKGKALDKKYFADFLCYNEIIVETKTDANLLPEHAAQLLNYLKATNRKLGILVNFGSPSLQWKRIVL